MATETFFHRIEKGVDWAIPIATVALAILIVAHFFIDLEQYEPIPTITDYFIIGIFILDLTFKWQHTKKLKKFVKLYWLDIIAVFPFYLLTRSIFAFSEFFRGELPGQVLHTLAGLRETEALREVEAVKAARGVRLGQRIVRILALRFRATHHAMIKTHLKHKRN